MAITSDYYGQQNKGRTFLDIYEVRNDSGETIIHRRLTDQDAYDSWHLSQYFKEILVLRELRNQGVLELDDIPRKEKHLMVYLLMAALPECRIVAELGCSLFELIDGLDVVQRYARSAKTLPVLDIADYRFLGVEISELLGKSAQLVHENRHIRICAPQSLNGEKFDILYDRAVSSFAYGQAEELARLLNSCTGAFVNLCLSREDTFSSVALGKPFTYFSQEELVKKVNKPLFHLFGESAPAQYSGEHRSFGRPVIEGFFLNCEESVAERMMDVARRDQKVRKYFQDKSINLKRLV